MKYLQLILWGSLFLISQASGATDEKELTSESDGKDILHANNDYKCPFIFGAFADPKDCAHFYVCVAGVAVHKKCGILQHFDILRRRCMPIIVAICGADKTSSTPAATASTQVGDNFKCTKLIGSFPHTNDCSKYFNCIAYVSILKTCPEKQLFDATKDSCKPENEVDCGTRQRPGYTTIGISTEPIVAEISETISTDDAENMSTTETISTTKLITESTPEDTTIVRPTGPPEHTCDEDDVDCIVTETGDVEHWFICPQDIGAFPHPSSDKLFIFCMNWIPSVKKCGMDLVFSMELSTCIETMYFAQLIL